MNKAYLLEPPRFDLSWLYERYQVKYIIPDKGEAIRLRDAPEELFQMVYEWAQKEFHPEFDSLALTGHLTMLVVTTLAIQRAWPDYNIRLLRYDSGIDGYAEIGYAKIFA